MGSRKDIKQRIANVSSVEQIIKAMDMVASTKLVKARAQLNGVRPIYHELKRVVDELSSRMDAHSHVFFKEREVKNSLYIILTSDRGLSGSYNTNILEKSFEHMQGKNEKIFVVGAKGNEYFKKRNKNIIRTIVGVADAQVYYFSESIAKWLTDFYLSGEAKEVFIAYTHFENVLSHTPIIEKLLPVATRTMDNTDLSDKKYEPSIDVFINHVVPLYLHMNIFRAFSESDTSEQAIRMVNMNAAGKNANEIIDELTRIYNRKRQAAQELSEIVGSANILNKGGLK